MFARPSALAAATFAFVAVALVPASMTAQAAQARASADRARTAQGDWTYEFTIRTGDDEVEGITRVSGTQSRIELHEQGRGRLGTRSKYLLVGDGGKTVYAIDPSDRSYTKIGAEEFTRLVGTAMNAVSRVVTMDLQAMDVTGVSLGDGETIAGHTTRRGKLVQEFTVRLGMLGFGADNQHRIETEYWYAPNLVLPRNPLIDMFATVPSVLAQHDEDFVQRSEAGRNHLVGRGTPLRIVIASREVEGEPASRTSARRAERARARSERREQRKTTTIEITSVERSRHDPAIFAVPSNYRLKDGFSWGTRP